MSSRLLDDEGIERSAVLLMSLDEDTAAEIFKYLSPRDAQELGTRMAGLGDVSNDRMNEVMHEFSDEIDQFSSVNLDSSNHIRSVLTKAMGEERAASLLEDIFDTHPGSGIDALNSMEPNAVAEMIRDEHPQIIATIMVHLQRNQAAEVLGHFDDALRNEVVLRVATFSGVQPAALQELTEVLSSHLDGQNLKRSKMGGISTAAEILNVMNSSQEETVLTNVREHDEDLAERIVDEMFVFEDMQNLDDRAIQRLMQDVETDSLGIALKGAADELIQRFTDNMSKRAADLLMDDMEMRGPVRMSQVEAERKSLLEQVRKLSDSGEINLSPGDDEYV